MKTKSYLIKIRLLAVILLSIVSFDDVKSQPLYGLFGQSNARHAQESSAYQSNDYVAVVYGGSSLSSVSERQDWNVSSRGELYDQMLDAIDINRPSLGSIWIQGENDAVNIDSALSYEKNLHDFLTGYNSNTGNAPIVIVMLSAKSSVSENLRAQQVEIIRQAQVNTSNEFQNVILLDPDKLNPTFVDHIHYSDETSSLILKESQNILKNQYSKLFLDALAIDQMNINEQTIANGDNFHQDRQSHSIPIPNGLFFLLLSATILMFRQSRT